MHETNWHEKWKHNEIAFHQHEANPLLVRHFSSLGLPQGSRIFIPLCGKTLDIGWLLSNGFRVAGAELSSIATEQMFAELGVAPAVSSAREVTRFSAPNVDIFVGDIFHLSSATLGPVDAVYDRAALIALPEPVRVRYTTHLRAITQNAPQLLISCEYDQTVMNGPPFSVTNEEVQALYSPAYHLSLLSTTDIAGGLKGRCPAKENVWLLAAPGKN